MARRHRVKRKNKIAQWIAAHSDPTVLTPLRKLNNERLLKKAATNKFAEALARTRHLFV